LFRFSFIRLALPLSGIFRTLLFFLLADISLPWLGPLTLHQSLLIELSWLVVTTLFELLFGRIIARRPWMELLQAFIIITGNLCIPVLPVIAASPILDAKLRGMAA
jgi:hypothetical protein